MFYKAIGIMSGSSLDGLDICFAEYEENGGKWIYEIKATDCIPYNNEWIDKLKNAVHLSAKEYLRLHTAYGHYIGEQVNRFIDMHHLHHQVQLIASHGHTTFHEPSYKTTGQLGDGAAIAAVTGINVVSDLRAMDIALNGQGAPIVPIGEKLLLGDHRYFLNLGGIANISANIPDNYIAFDVCPANRVLNMLVKELGHEYDDRGAIAATGSINGPLLNQLNNLDFYKTSFPKSLANDYGTDIIYPIIQQIKLSVPDALRTYVEHIAIQIKNAIVSLEKYKFSSERPSILVCGGGALNNFQIERLKTLLSSTNVEVVAPARTLIEFKEALIMGLIGVLRWREENNVLHTVTGASRSSIGGAIWIGQNA